MKHFTSYASVKEKPFLKFRWHLLCAWAQLFWLGILGSISFQTIQCLLCLPYQMCSLCNFQKLDFSQIQSKIDLGPSHGALVVYPENFCEPSNPHPWRILILTLFSRQRSSHTYTWWKQEVKENVCNTSNEKTMIGLPKVYFYFFFLNLLYLLEEICLILYNISNQTFITKHLWII